VAAKASLTMPKNAATRRQYSGINVLILWGAVIECGLSTQYWLTFRQYLCVFPSGVKSWVILDESWCLRVEFDCV
jgi:N-terminal domain of anti-restriction factor ArdC